MATKCPHCSEPIENLSGFISQEKLEERLRTKTESHKDALKAKDTEIELLEGTITDLKGRAGNYDAVVAERDTLKRQNAQITQAQTRRGALEKLPGWSKVPAESRDEVLGAFEAIYNSKVAGLADGEQPDFTEFDKWGADKHPLLSGYVVKPEGADNPPNTQPKPPPGLPNNNDGAGPPPEQPQGKMTAAQLQAYFDSPAYTNLTPEKRQEKYAELQAQHMGPAVHA